MPLCAVLGALGCSAAGDGGGGHEAGTTTPGTPDDAGKSSDLFPIPANVWLVNAGLAGDVRICLRPGDPKALPDDNTIPATNYPGLSRGQAAHLRAGVQGETLTPVLYDAHKVAVLESAGSFSCSALAQILTPIAVGTVALGNGPSVLSITGCPPSTPNGASRCGADYGDATGNLKMIASPIAASYDERKPMGAQVLNLSPSVASLQKVRWSLGALPAAGCNSAAFVEAQAVVGTAVPSVATPILAPTEFDSSGVSLCDTSMGRSSPIVNVSFAAQQLATDPASVPSEHFATKGNFVFVVVGDVGGSGADALRVLALPFGLTK